MGVNQKKKIKQKRWEERIPLLASFLFPLLITIIICISHEVYPFGDRCILKVDMYHQYCPFFTEFMERLKSGRSLMYSFQIGLGADFLSLYAYYLASPLNWLLLFCPRGSVIEFMTILVVLKIALCGLTFGFYLKKHFGTNHFALGIFASAYALSGFMAAYAWNIMWTDCLALMPLIVLGLERLVEEGKAGLYYGTLAVSVLCNYYISFMICFFLVLYFLILWMETKRERIKTALRFAWYSVLAGGTGAVLMIPEAIILGQSGSKGISFPDKVEWYFHIITELGRHCMMTEGHTGNDHWPNIYCGVFVLLLMVLYVLNKEISWKRKLPRLLLAAFFVVSFSNNVLDFIWHGLHFPDSLPGRQSFLYLFLLLVICFEAFLRKKGIRIWHIFVALAADAAFMAAVYRFGSEALTGIEEVLATSAYLICYGIFLLISKLGTKTIRQWAFGLGCIAVVSELAVNFDMTGLGTTSRSSYIKNAGDYRIVLAEAEEKEAASSRTGAYFYRTEELERKTKNDASFYGYYSATQFSSLMNINVSHTFQKVGMEGGKNFYCINGATPLLSAMLSVKYVIADNEFEENPIRMLVASSGNTYLYENRYSLPLGYMVGEDVISLWNGKNGNDIENQNELAFLLGAKEEMLTEVDGFYEEGISTIIVPEDGYIFATYDTIKTDSLKEEISDGRTKEFTKASHGYTLDLGYCSAGDEIKITNTNQETVRIHAYMLHPEAVEAACQTLSRQTMELESFSETDIKGKIAVTEAGRLVFSIAKEAGWNLYVDGEETEGKLFAGAFLSTYLEEGTHTIELKYQTPGLKEGFLISLGSLGMFFLTIFLKHKSLRATIKKVFTKLGQGVIISIIQ